MNRIEIRCTYMRYMNYQPSIITWLYADYSIRCVVTQICYAAIFVLFYSKRDKNRSNKDGFTKIDLCKHIITCVITCSFFSYAHLVPQTGTLRCRISRKTAGNAKSSCLIKIMRSTLGEQEYVCRMLINRTHDFATDQSARRREIALPPLPRLFSHKYWSAYND